MFWEEWTAYGRFIPLPTTANRERLHNSFPIFS